MARRPRKGPIEISTPLILDSGAVIALSRGDERARAFVGRALETNSELHVPSVAIAETVRGRGPRDAPVERVLAAIDSVLTINESTGRVAGRLLGRARSKEAIDALVVGCAIELGGGRILTSDPDDLKPLAHEAKRVTIHRV